ncbi:hypothetical protein [Saccharicrinis aurantiacus]|uniref:hypothetical protein n=1 Tax=Saccharicrinis aurantiacus TaxID=1849719 RepID=UPI0009501CCF|nr:hypothetical protein [Saccharicrinis aurantiacus]
MNPIKYLNGLGVVASNKRTLKDGTRYNKYFAPPKRQDKYLTYAGNTNDTIEFMSEIIKSTLADTRAIAPVLRGRDTRSTLSNIFSFVFDHIQYKPDDPQNEELRRPVRAWGDRISGVDCDCYSILIGSILSNLNIPFALRMVKIGGKPYYQHVYVVVPKNGKRNALSSAANYFTVDPVLDTFNEEHPFTGKYDLFMQPIKYLNGVPSVSLSGLQGNTNEEIFYSEDAAQTPQSNVIFFDGVNYYDRADDEDIEHLIGLQGLDGLGFLRKIWGAVKTAGKFIKKIGGKALKKVTHKKNGSKRGVFKLLSKKRTPSAAMQPMASKGLTPINVSAPSSLTPIGTRGGNTQVTPKDMVDIASSMDKSMGVDSILNLTRSLLPDNTMVSKLIDAKAEASIAKSQGINPLEARVQSADIAKAQTAEAKVDMMKTIYDMNQNKSGFSMNPNMIMMGIMGIGLVATIVLTRPKTA